LKIDKLSKILKQERNHGKNNKKSFSEGWHIILVIILSFFSCNTKTTDTLTIAAAANVQFALDTLTALFEHETGIKTNIITGSSGKLTAQIMQGAPYDIFLSADMKYPEQIFNKGKGLKAPEIYAYGSLILWTFKDDVEPDPEILTSDLIRRIAIANPKTAPYGVVSVEFLKKMKLFEKVKDKLIFGESISQVNQFITSRSADIGFSAESVALSSRLTDTGHWVKLDDTKYEPIRQGVIIIDRENGQSDDAEIFFSFLLSPRVKIILSEFGYKTHLSNE